MPLSFYGCSASVSHRAWRPFQDLVSEAAAIAVANWNSEVEKDILAYLLVNEEAFT